MTLELMALPYPYDALEPAMSRETLRYHHDEHHRGYVEKLNKLLEESGTRAPDLERLVSKSKGDIFNNAAQVWNHDFFWKCLRPIGGNPPVDSLIEALRERWDSLEEFQKEFAEAAIAQFGSGWTWLVMDPRRGLQVMSTANADTPIRQGLRPLLTCDVWEHAYYLDHRNRRDQYLDAFWKLVNWDHVEAERQFVMQESQSEEGRRPRWRAR